MGQTSVLDKVSQKSRLQISKTTKISYFIESNKTWNISN